MASSDDNNPGNEPKECRKEPQSLGYQRPTPAELPRNPFLPPIFTHETFKSRGLRIAQNDPGATSSASSTHQPFRPDGRWTSRSKDQSCVEQIYHPISGDQVRLLTMYGFEMGEMNAKIECSLESHSLGDSPNYDAVSYAWGDRRDTAAIVVNGQDITVTTSLRDALVALRKPDQTVTLWVDALSINQSDIEELNCQVRMMAEIYAAASAVVIWLGPASETENIKFAFRSLENVLYSQGHGRSSKIRAIINSTSTMEAIVSVFEKEYWKRLWITQEIFYARHAWVQCGMDYIRLATLIKAADLLNEPRWKSKINEKYPPGRTLSRTSKTHYSYAQVIATQGPKGVLGPLLEKQYTDHVPGIVKKETLPSPLVVMRICRSKLAARPQDKVLGILSLLPKAISKNIKANFYHTPNEIFTEIVSAIITRTGSLDIICEAIYYPFRQDTFNLPSWVPDWSHAPDTPSLAAISLYHRKAFAASGKASKYPRQWPERSDLPITAVVLGAVRQRGMAVGTLGRLTNYLMAFLVWRHILLDECGENCSTAPEVFCRTLCAGDVPSTLDLGAESRPVNGRDWEELSYHLWAQFFNKRLPRIPLDEELSVSASMNFNIEESVGRRLIQQYYGSRMMGRCFCFIEDKGEKLHMGMGTGYMAIGDLVVVAHGCSVPIIIRPIGHEGKYQFVGDIYVDGFMDGEALKNKAERGFRDFTLC